MQSLESWADCQYRHAAAAMLESISPVGLVKHRPGFGQRVVAKRGAIVASPALADYDPDPDYFFHWYRDSAIVIDALRQIDCDGIGPRAREHFADFIRFSVALGELDGRRFVEAPEWRQTVQENYVKYLRSDEELAAVRGEAILEETRVNPDGTLDISRWPRPQHDGPALRALAVLRWTRSAHLERDIMAGVSALLSTDLAFTLARARIPCFDIWEEELGSHYYTLRIAAAALEDGADWLDSASEPNRAAACRGEARRLLEDLDAFWDPATRSFRSRFLASGERSAKELDMSVILAAVHSGAAGERHTARDPRMHSTLDCLQRLFANEYPINQGRSPGRAPAMGRYPQDRYYSGGAYYFTTLAAAELCFRAAAEPDGTVARTWASRGDEFLETVRAFTPASGDLAEQFDRTSGIQTSAKRLAWSYAAFITCIGARRALHRERPPS